jgi:hypothetical protein
VPEKSTPENIIYESGFTAAGDARDAGKTANRKRDVDFLKIVFSRACDGKPAIKMFDV